MVLMESIFVINMFENIRFKLFYLCSVLFHTMNLKVIDNVCIICTNLGLNFILTNFDPENDYKTGSGS